VTCGEIEKIWKTRLSRNLREKVKKYDFRYFPLTRKERKFWLVAIRNTLQSPIRRAGRHRLDEWEAGWFENLKMLLAKKDVRALVPLYYSKYKVIRWRQQLIRPVHRNFEVNMLSLAQEWLFGRYFKNMSSIYDFGCGTGYNLLMARKVNRTAKLYGLDWAKSSQKIIKMIAKGGLLSNVHGRNFDFFNPDYRFTLDKNSGVYTVGALEQTGRNFRKFIDYLLFNKPKVCVNLEIMSEFLNPKNFLDKTSIDYARKRNYLNGFFDYLRLLERKKKIVIHQAQRLYIGALHNENPSVVVWSPVS